MTEYITVTEASPASRSGAIKLHDAAGFEGMRRAGHLAAEVLDALVPHVVPGVTTEELDDLVREHMLRGGGVTATLGYRRPGEHRVGKECVGTGKTRCGPHP